VAGEARTALREAGVGREEMTEIAYVVASTDFMNRAYTILAIPSRALERMPEQLYMRLLRPLISRLMQGNRSRGRPMPLEAEPSHPYARLVRAYAGSPIAPALVQAIEEMWASPLLSRRCKLLMLAVVARGLGCEACATEIAASLQQEVMEGAALARILTHLDGPELSHDERLLLHFARETIWYEPGTLQRRARALMERLPVPQFLEAVGVAALGNGLCRLGAMVMEEC
jgi:alkylhydroperoxidase family enzyme